MKKNVVQLKINTKRTVTEKILDSYILVRFVLLISWWGVIKFVLVLSLTRSNPLLSCHCPSYRVKFVYDNLGLNFYYNNLGTSFQCVPDCHTVWYILDYLLLCLRAHTHSRAHVHMQWTAYSNSTQWQILAYNTHTHLYSTPVTYTSGFLCE